MPKTTKEIKDSWCPITEKRYQDEYNNKLWFSQSEVRVMILKYAKYTINKHSSEFEDINELNKCFMTNIILKDIKRGDKE